MEIPDQVGNDKIKYNEEIKDKRGDTCSSRSSGTSGILAGRGSGTGICTRTSDHIQGKGKD